MSAIYSPTLHLNGSDGETLFEALAQASGALRAARVALGNAAPNARDYYVGVRELNSLGDLAGTLTPGACPFARVQGAHEARLRTLIELQEQLSAIASDLREQLDEREARRAR